MIDCGPNAPRVAQAYRMRIEEGISWTAIAERLGFANYAAAVQAVSRFATANGLPTVRKVRPELSDRYGYYRGEARPRPLRGRTFEEAVQAVMPNVTQRKCLRCSKPFASDWAGNRICRRCKDDQTWATVEDDDYAIHRP